MMPVSALAVRDSRLVVASANGIVRLYDVHTLAPWMQINAASRFVSALALHPTRDCFAVAAEDGTLNVFSLPPVNHQVGPPSHPHTLTLAAPHARLLRRGGGGRHAQRLLAAARQPPGGPTLTPSHPHTLTLAAPHARLLRRGGGGRHAQRLLAVTRWAGTAATCRLRNGRFGLCTGRQRMALERGMPHKWSRRMGSSRCGLNSCKRGWVGVAKQRRELVSLPAPSPLALSSLGGTSVVRWRAVGDTGLTRRGGAVGAGGVSAVGGVGRRDGHRSGLLRRRRGECCSSGVRRR
jgi:hypothetical protein